MAVVVEAVAVGDLAFDAPYGEVHPGKAPGRVVGLLPPDGDVAPRPAAVAVARRVGLYELDGLHEHAGRAAARVVHPARVRFEHLDEQPDDAARRVELAALLALRARELPEKVLVDAPEHVVGAGALVAHGDVADHVDEPAEPLLVQRGAGVVLRQDVLERGVVALDPGHRVVDEPADGGLARPGTEVRPACLGRDPEDGLGGVLVGVLRGFLTPLGEHGGVALLEGVGDVLQEDETQHDMLVLGGVHRAAERVGHRPEFGFVDADGRGGSVARLDGALRLSGGHGDGCRSGGLGNDSSNAAGNRRPVSPRWSVESRPNVSLIHLIKGTLWT